MNSEMFNKQYIKNDDFIIVNENDNFIYVNYDQALWLRTDLTGIKIANLCDGTKTLNEVFDKLAEDEGIHGDLLKEMCNDFLQQMILERVIYCVDAPKEEIYPPDQEMLVDYPNSIWIHLTSDCNLLCPFCYSKSDGEKHKTLEYDEIIAFLSNIPEDKRKDIVFSGGEPFLYKRLVELVKCLKEDLKFNKLTIITNGTVGNQKYEEIAQYVDILQFSVDSAEKEIYELTRGKDNFEKLVGNLKAAKAAGIKDRVISFTPTINNIETLKGLPQFCLENGISSIHITHFMPVGRGQESIDHLQVPTEKFEEELEKFMENYKIVNEEIRVKRELYEIGIPENERSKFIMISMAGDVSQKIISLGRRYSCGLGAGIISLNYDGNFYACPSLHHEEFIMGSIKDHIDDVMSKGRIINRDLHVDNDKMECKSCTYRYFCGGGCRAISYAEKNIYSKNSNCDLEISRIDSAMKNMLVW